MKINWKVRLRNPVFWAEVAAAAVLPILAQLGLSWEDMDTWAALWEALTAAVKSPVILTAVAEDEKGNLQGFVFCSILRLAPEYLCRGESSVGYLNDLYVAPNARHQGLAQKLTAYAESWLREQDVKVMELQVLGMNENAQQYWKQQAMEPIGILCCKYL